MSPYDALLDDLEAEEAELDAVVAGIPDGAWLTRVPTAGWDVRDEIAHLAVAEELATVALTDADAFGARLAELLADTDRLVDELEAQGRAMPGAEVLEWWRAARGPTIAHLRERDPKDRVPWIAGPMSAMSFATARVMETWAHGQDVVDGLGVSRPPTARLRHIAELGVRTRPFAYVVRGHDVPDGAVAVELTAPDGSTWTWGESDTDVVRGPAVDFCLVVTQRRHPDDTALEVVGPLATEWITIAQAFAGPATDQRAPAGRTT